jgi:hypothetical protein
MLKTIVTIILLVFIAMVLFWSWLKKYVWLKICRQLVNYLMGGKKQ